MNEKDRIAVRSVSRFKDAAEPVWPDDMAAADGRPHGEPAGLVGLRYIKSAIRRSILFWCALAVIGLAVGAGYKIARPAPYQATTTILLPQDQLSAGAAILTDMALAQSRVVAGLAATKLGLAESAAGFASSYTVTDPTSDVLVITATAPSANDAVRRANVVADVFLEFRASLLATQQKVTVSSLDGQISQAEAQIRSLGTQISDVSVLPGSAANRAKLAYLQAQLGQANNALSTANSGVQSSEQQTALQVKESKVLDPAALIAKPRKKPVLLGAVIGLFAGLVLGLGIVVVRAVVSDRLRQRDDVAFALGAPVQLSVGRISLRSWLPIGDLARPSNPHVRRLVAYLHEAVPHDSGPPATLAIVPVDGSRVPALCVASLAVSSARQGSHVVLADLTADRMAARFVGVSGSGVVATAEGGGRLTVALPDAADSMPVGPWPGAGWLERLAPGREVADECARADLLLVLAKLDPATDANLLATWSSDAVVFVTAGRSSWTRLHATAELLRLARVRLASAVLVGADRSDDSLGMAMHVRASWRHEVPRHGRAEIRRGLSG